MDGFHPDLADRIARIRCLILDVDGVLTNGQIVYGEPCLELKAFHVRDGSAIQFWRRAGHAIAIVSGRNSDTVNRRAAELGIEAVFQGSKDKSETFQRLQAQLGISPESIAAIGDDLPDLPLLERVGIRLAVAVACEEVRQVADYVTKVPGGSGAVRDAIEWLLKHQGKWSEIVASFRTKP